MPRRTRRSPAATATQRRAEKQLRALARQLQQGSRPQPKKERA